MPNTTRRADQTGRRPTNTGQTRPDRTRRAGVDETESGTSERDGRTDRELLDAFVAGDVEAFGEIDARHHRFLTWAAWREITHDADAADAVQDALVKAMAHAATFRGGCPVRAWLYRIAVHAAREMRRDGYWRFHEFAETADVDLAAEWSHTHQAQHADPAAERSRADRDARAAVVARAIAALPATERTAVELVHLQNHSYRDAAAITGWCLSTVKSRANRARARLALALSEVLTP